jgi:hypothetical protein
MRDASVHERQESILSLFFVIHNTCRNVYDLNNVFDLVLNIELGSLDLHIVSLGIRYLFKINQIEDLA